MYPGKPCWVLLGFNHPFSLILINPEGNRGSSRKEIRDFLGGPVVKNPPSNAGDAGLIPGRGTKIPHAAGQLSPLDTTTEPTHPGVCAPQLEREKPAGHS